MNEGQFKQGQAMVLQNPQTPLVQPHEVGSAEKANNINAGIISGRK